MPLFRRQKQTKNSSSSSSFNKRLRMECLEQKNLLAGDVMAAVIGGDLFITGDGANNSVQIVRDASPGVGDVVVQGLLSNPTTINGGGPQAFQVTGDVFIDFSAGGQNAAVFGENPVPQPDPVELPGNVDILGGAGLDIHSFTNAMIAGNVSMDDTAGGASSFLGASLGTVIGGNFTLDSAAGGSEIGIDDATINGDVVMLGNSASLESFLGIIESTVGGDVRHLSTAVASTTDIQSTAIGDDLVIDTGDGVDSVSIGLEASSTVVSTIGDDLRIKTHGGADEIILIGFDVADDLVINAGDGDDVVEIDSAIVNNIVGDDLYVSGKGGGDEIVVAGTDIVDKLRISGNGGDDFVEVSAVTVGRTALISLGSGLNEADVTDLTGARGLTVLGRGENNVTLNDVTTSHYVDVLTSSGNDLVQLFNVNTYSLWIATFAGVDEVSINNSEVDYLFVFLGSGDDTLTLNNVTVNRLAVLSGGSGDDTLVDLGDASEINFEIDFAFENYGV